LARRPTILDLAQAAGVSVATVDRVLNGRLPVREETARRVSDAATAIGYHASSLITRRLEQSLPHNRLGFVLQRHNQAFYQGFAREIGMAAAAAQGFRANVVVEFVDNQTPGEVVAKLKAVAAQTQAVAMVSVDHPTITSAVMMLQEQGTPVFSLLSDFAAGVRQGYLGLDNRKAGRTAAWFIARAAQRTGKIGVFVGSHRFLGHEIREIGFRSYFRENAPHFEVLDALVNLEDRHLAHEATLELLQRHPDLAGLYVAGGGMEGVIAALREEGMAGKLAVVCNEIIPETRAGLAENLLTVAIATPIERLCAELVRMMAEAIAGNAPAPAQSFLPFDIYTSENL
jgi:LacI family transcriptional regulator